jgi:hypothetical protein
MDCVAHGLCQLSRSELCSGVLQGAVPTCMSKAALDDCNQNLIIWFIYNTFQEKTLDPGSTSNS